MTTLEAVEVLERGISGGVKTDEGKFDRAYLIEQMNQGRAVIARNDFTANKFWNPSLIQYCYPEFNNYYQENACVNRFKLPTGFITANDETLGITYAGSNYVDAPLRGQSFVRIKSRNELNSILHNPRMSPLNGHFIGYMIEGDVLTVISDVKVMCLGGVFQYPEKVEGFSITKDSYPINIELFQLVQTYLYQQLGIQASTPADTLPNSSNTSTPQNLATMVNKRMAGGR